LELFLQDQAIAKVNFEVALADGRTCDLLAYRRLAPNAQRNHPTEEHLLPLFVALGASGPNAAAERIHSSTTYGVLRMDAYAFGPKPGQNKNEGDHHA
jgi:4,5-DOPA dioxygenase extradiol